MNYSFNTFNGTFHSFITSSKLPVFQPSPRRPYNMKGLSLRRMNYFHFSSTTMHFFIHSIFNAFNQTVKCRFGNNFMKMPFSSPETTNADEIMYSGVVFAFNVYLSDVTALFFLCSAPS